MPQNEPKKHDSLVMVSVLLLGAAWTAHIVLREMGYPPGDKLRLAVTAILIACFGFAIYAYARLFRNLDEFHRQVQLMALSIAFPLSLVAAFAVGFLRGEGFFLRADSRDLPLVMILTYAVGMALAWRRYR